MNYVDVSRSVHHSLALVDILRSPWQLTTATNSILRLKRRAIARNTGGVQRKAEERRHSAEARRRQEETRRELGEQRREAAETARITAEGERVAAEGIRNDAMISVGTTAESLHVTLQHMRALEDLRRALRDALYRSVT